VLVDKRSGLTPQGYVLFLFNGQLGFQMANGVGSGGCVPSPTPGQACVNYVAPPTSPNVADGQWHHVAVVVDRSDATSGVRLYVDGALVFTGAPMVAPFPDNLDNTSDLYLGMFPGDLDEVELFKRALTAQEIQAIFQAGAAGKCKLQPPGEATADLGDAPDSTNHPNKPMTAYPTVPAKFPTVFDPVTGLPQGPKHLAPKKLAWLGKDVSFEDEADLPPDADGLTNIDPGADVADQDKHDDGVLLPVAIPLVCGQTQFKYTVTSTVAAKLYVNVWFDFNRDGDWDDPIQKCPLGPAITGSFTEWAVQNDLITVPGPGTFTFMTPAFGAANPTKGSEMWMRITLTDQPIAPANGADGSGPAGGYQYGETEDYLLKLQYTELCGIKFNDLNGNGKQDPGESGLANWVIEVKDANGNIIGYAETDPNGRYCIVVPSPGTYTVSEQQQQGWVQTAPPAPGTYTVTVPPAHTDLNFGNQQKGKCDLMIRKTVTPNPVASGGTVTITLTVTNVGTGPCPPGPEIFGTAVRDPKPAGLTFTAPPAANQPGWQCSLGLPTGDASCGAPGLTLPPGYTVTFTINATVTATAGSQIQNCATVTNANDTNLANNKSCVTIQVVPGGVCDREIKKTVTPNPVASGGTVTITLTVTNVGTAACPAVPGVVLADPQPPGMTFQPPVSVSKPGWACFITGPSGAWPGGVQCTSTSPLLPGAANAVTITFTAKVTAPAGSMIQNCAEVTNVGDAVQTNNKSCVTINVTGIKLPPDLALAKLLDGQLRAEQEATYVLRITNGGGGPTSAPIVVSDPLPSTLRFVSASGPGWSCAAQGQNVTCRSPGPIAPGQVSTILLRVRVVAPAGTQITNCATVETAGDTNPANNRGCHTGTVQR